MKIIKNAIMKEYSNMKIGGIAKELIFIDNKNELKEIYDDRENIFLIGNGTNTLISDSNLDICFLSLKNLDKIEILEKNEKYALVKVGAGKDFLEFIHFMEENNLSGIENMTGIPGSIGGITNMNGGAYGTEIFDVIVEVEVFDKNEGIKILKKDEMDFRYRGTEIKDNKWVVVSTTLKLGYGFDKEASEDKLTQRKQKHPLEFPNLGSTFKNPKGTFAAQLISDCNLKKYRIGDIEVSEKHPNFLINLGNAKFDDVLKLIEHIKKVVKSKTDINLETEIIILK